MPYYVDALTGSVPMRWNSPSALGTPVTVTYDFLVGIPPYDSAATHPGFAPMTEAQKAAARDVLRLYAEVANIGFTEVADGGSIRFGTDLQAPGMVGYAYLPGAELGGDVWLNNGSSAIAEMTPGHTGHWALLHEIGHALGLKHPGDYFGGAEAGPYLPVAEDSLQYSVMSYNGHPHGIVAEVTGTAASYSWTLFSLRPDGPQLYDIAAVQQLYGVNTATRAGNDVYAFDVSTPLLHTIWDGGGTDAIDASTSTRPCLIDLNAGGFSSLGLVADPAELVPSWARLGAQPTYDGSNNLGIAFGVVIENAFGGSGTDTLIGNAAANWLVGGSGNDSLSGGSGADILDGGAGADRLQGGKGNDLFLVDDSGDLVSEVARNGKDLVKSAVSFVLVDNIEKLKLTGRQDISGWGNDAGNTVTGNPGDNVLEGLGGQDRLAGGAGTDWFRYGQPGDGGDVIVDFRTGIDKIAISASGFGLTGQGALAPEHLAGAVAADGDDWFGFDPATHHFGFDADGNGMAAPVVLAQLSGLPAIVASDIYLV